MVYAAEEDEALDLGVAVGLELEEEMEEQMEDVRVDKAEGGQACRCAPSTHPVALPDPA